MSYIPLPAIGDVDGPISATDTALVLYDGITGKIIKDSTITSDGTSLVSAGTLRAATISGTNVLSTDITVEAIVNASGLAAGTFTPTPYVTANLASVSGTIVHWNRVGNMVNVGGRFTADPILTATATSFSMDLPVPSLIGSVDDITGVAYCGNIANMGAEIIGVPASGHASVKWVASDLNNQTWSYIYNYLVL